MALAVQELKPKIKKRLQTGEAKLAIARELNVGYSTVRRVAWSLEGKDENGRPIVKSEAA